MATPSATGESPRSHRPGRVPGLVSVIIPSYNKGVYIERTLDSLAAQTYPDVEVIVVDDASSDGSVALVEAWAACNPTTPIELLVHHENKGVCRTLNDGFGMARGEYVACLAADDRYLPHRIDSHVRLLNDNPKASFAVGDTLYENVDGDFRGVRSMRQHPSGKVFSHLIRGNFILAPAVTMRGSSLDAVGPYDENLPYEDYDLWLRLARVGTLVYTQSVDNIYVVNVPGSLSNTLGRESDVGHLKILAKYRADSLIDRSDLDLVATKYVHRLAKQDSQDQSPVSRARALANASLLYGDHWFAFEVLKAAAFAHAKKRLSGWLPKN